MLFSARNKRILGAILLFFNISCLCFPAFAESKSLSISPIVNYFDRPDEGTEKFDLKVENTSDKNLQLKIYTAPYSVLNDDFDTSFDEKDRTEYNEITNWIFFKNNEGSYEKTLTFNIERKTTKHIDYKISFQESEEREQYCVIFVEIIPEQQESQQSTIRLASFVVAHDGNIEENIELENSGSDSFLVQNKGENSSKISYTYEVSSIFGKKLYEDSTEKVIYPNSSRSFEFVWDDIPEFGFFKQKLSIKTQKETKTQETIIVKIPTFLKIIMILLLTFIIFMLIIKNENRKECGDSSVQNKNN